MKVREILENLVEINNLGAEEHTLQERLDHIPGDINAAKRRLQKRKDQLDALRASADECRAKSAKIDTRLHEVDDLLKKYAKQLDDARTEQEINALNHQMERLHDETESLEEEGLGLVESEDEARKKVAEEIQKLPAYEDELKKDLLRFETRNEEFAEQLALIQVEKDNRLKTLDEETAETWLRMVDRHGAESAIVPLENFANCGGCNMSLVRQTCEAASRMDLLTRCEKCGRFLYDPEQVSVKSPVS